MLSRRLLRQNRPFGLAPL